MSEAAKSALPVFEPVVDYTPVGGAERTSLDAALERGPIKAIGSAVYALACHDPDWRWFQIRCMSLFDHPHPEVKRMAVVSLHVSIVKHDHFDGLTLLPALRRVRRDLFLPRDLDRLGFEIEMRAGLEDDYSVWVEPDREAFVRARDRRDLASFTCHLIGLSLEDPDWRWVQAESLEALSSRDDQMRRVGVTSLDNLLALRGVLDLDWSYLDYVPSRTMIRYVMRCAASSTTWRTSTCQRLTRL